jgi:hypothetical protein
MVSSCCTHQSLIGYVTRRNQVNWFEELTGFRERSPNQFRETITLKGGNLLSQWKEKIK